MGWKKALVPSLITALVCEPALASRPCEDLAAGKYPTVSDFGEVLAKAKSSAVNKDEFESTVAYNARARAAAGAIGVGEVAVLWPLESYTFTYDADAQRVTYSRSALSTTCLTSEFSLSGAAKAVTYIRRNDRFSNPYCITRLASWGKTREYEASNAYGARTVVSATDRKEFGVFLGMGDLGLDFWTSGRRDAYADHEHIFEAIVAPEAARSLKQNGSALMVLRPKAPFYTPGTHHTVPTFDRPSSISTKTDFVVASISCVALVDPTRQAIYQVRQIPAYN